MATDRRCPHNDIRFCPLYHASHGGAEFNGTRGCVDAKAEPYACAVDQGRVSYAELAGAMKEKAPRYVAQLEWRQALEESREQQARNIRHNGIH